MFQTYYFEVIDENSELSGERFFVEVDEEDDPRATAWDIAVENFPDVALICYGRVSEVFAESMGYDTY